MRLMGVLFGLAWAYVYTQSVLTAPAMDIHSSPVRAIVLSVALTLSVVMLIGAFDKDNNLK